MLQQKQLIAEARAKKKPLKKELPSPASQRSPIQPAWQMHFPESRSQAPWWQLQFCPQPSPYLPSSHSGTRQQSDKGQDNGTRCRSARNARRLTELTGCSCPALGTPALARHAVARSLAVAEAALQAVGAVPPRRTGCKEELNSNSLELRSAGTHRLNANFPQLTPSVAPVVV